MCPHAGLTPNSLCIRTVLMGGHRATSRRELEENHRELPVPVAAGGERERKLREELASERQARRELEEKNRELEVELARERQARRAAEEEHVAQLELASERQARRELEEKQRELEQWKRELEAQLTQALGEIQRLNHAARTAGVCRCC